MALPKQVEDLQSWHYLVGSASVIPIEHVPSAQSTSWSQNSPQVNFGSTHYNPYCCSELSLASLLVGCASVAVHCFWFIEQLQSFLTNLNLEPDCQLLLHLFGYLHLGLHFWFATHSFGDLEYSQASFELTIQELVFSSKGACRLKSLFASRSARCRPLLLARSSTKWRMPEWSTCSSCRCSFQKPSWRR